MQPFKSRQYREESGSANAVITKTRGLNGRNKSKPPGFGELGLTLNRSLKLSEFSMVLYAHYDQQSTMPSLHPDPSSLPVLPIKSARIMLAIRDPLLRLHHQGMPPWYQELEATMATLIDLGIKISVYPQAVEVQNKLHALAAVVPPSDTVYTTIDNQLIRDMRDIVHKRCDNGFLSLFLALVDGWLRSCEEYIRRSSGKHFADDFSGFEDAYKELMVIATPNIANKAYRFDNFVYLFDNLGLTNS